MIPEIERTSYRYLQGLYLFLDIFSLLNAFLDLSLVLEVLLVLECCL